MDRPISRQEGRYSLFDFPRVVFALNRQPYQGQTGDLTNLIQELIPFLSLQPIVTRVVQLDRQQRFHGARVANEKVQVLLGDPVEKGVVFIRARYKEDIGQPDFRLDRQLCAKGHLLVVVHDGILADPVQGGHWV